MVCVPIHDDHFIQVCSHFYNAGTIFCSKNLSYSFTESAPLIILPLNFLALLPNAQSHCVFIGHPPKPNVVSDNLSTFIFGEKCKTYLFRDRNENSMYVSGLSNRFYRLCQKRFLHTGLFPPIYPIYVRHAETDSSFFNIFWEHTRPSPIVLGSISGLSRFDKHSQSQLVCICLLFLFLCMRYGAYLLWFHSRIYQHGKHKYAGKRMRRYRHYIACAKVVIFSQNVIVPLFALLLISGDIHPNPGPVFPHSRRHPEAQSLNVGSWNVRTLLETKHNVGRPTAIVARELDRYNIDIAGLSETRVLGDTIIDEIGGGYTFFLKGKPDGDKRHHGVGFAIRSKLVQHITDEHPVGINERLMTMSIPLDNFTLSILSVYAPTLASSNETKESFYDDLDKAIKNIPASHKLLVIGDFNARVGTDYKSWENIIGRHGVGNENSNGTLLLSLCSQHDLAITNTMFQQADKHKTTWMHPGSKQWHLIDYVITRQRDIKDVHSTRAMCGTHIWSDHRLVKTKLSLYTKTPQLRQRMKPHRKPDVAKLKSPEVRSKLATKLQEAYDATVVGPNDTATSIWDTFKDITLKVTEEVLGFPERKHRDWFDENDILIKPLLDQLHCLHRETTDDKNNIAKANAYISCKKLVQTSLRTMQNMWWHDRAAEMQAAADHRDMKTFYIGLKAVYGPKYKATSSIKSKDGVLLTEPEQIRDRWAEHFNGVLNQNSNFDMSVLEEVPQWDVNHSLDTLPTLDEVLKSISQLTCGKSPGDDGIPPDIYKYGGPAVAKRLLDLFILIWREGNVPQDFRDANLAHLYKNKGDRACCDNHRGISLLCIAGKILARLLLNRLNKHICNINLIPESQCGFQKGRGTADMVFSLRQLQEKCKLQNQDLYLVFIDLTKAFDTVNRDGLWCILEKAGCPPLFVSIVRSFHENMKVSVKAESGKSAPFSVTSGTKQGCVLAPLLFSIFFSLMLHVAFKDSKDGVDIKSRFDRGLCRTSNMHLQAKTKVTISTIRDLLFADDCALASSTLDGLQRLCDCFAAAASRFGLTISIKKTETMYQPAPGNTYVPPTASIDGKQLNAVTCFNYLGSTISNDASIDLEITGRIAKATSAFGRLYKRLWANRNIRLDTKISVYKASVLTTLLYGCETWTLRKQHIHHLEKFHQTSLRKISRIRWFHKKTNYEVLEQCKTHSLESMIDSARLRWTGHVVRMPNSRIPKALLYGHLTKGESTRGNHKTYLNSIKTTLRACMINPVDLEALASQRNSWRATCKAGVKNAEKNRIDHLKDKRKQRKARAALAQQST